MKQAVLIILLMCCVMLSGCGHKLTLNERDKTIPREVALEYLQDESGKYASTHQCIYTNFGVSGTPYTDLVWERSAWGLPEVWLLKKGESTNMIDQSAVVCFPILHNSSSMDYTQEEWEKALNRTISALEVLGVRPKSEIE